MNILSTCALHMDALQSGEVSCVAFHPTSIDVCIAIGTEIFILDSVHGYQRARITQDSVVAHLVVSRDYFASITEDGTLSLWDWKTARLVYNQKYEKGAEQSTLMFARDAPLLLFNMGRSKYVNVFNADSMEPMMVCKRTSQINCKQAVSTIACHPTDPLFATYSNGSVSIWNHTTGSMVCTTEEVTRLLQGQGLALTANAYLSFSRNGTYLCVATDHGLLCSLRLSDKSLQLFGNTFLTMGTIAAAQFHPFQSIIIAVSSDGIIASWDESCSATGNVKVGFINELEAVDRTLAHPLYERGEFPDLNVKHMELHPTKNLMIFTYQNISTTPQPSAVHHMVYSLMSPAFPAQTFLPMIARKTYHHDFVRSTEAPDTKVFFLEEGTIMCTDLASPSLARTPISDVPFQDIGGNRLWPSRILCGDDTHFLVFFSKHKIPDPNVMAPRALDMRCALIGANEDVHPGRDGFFWHYGVDGGVSGCLLSDVRDAIHPFSIVDGKMKTTKLPLGMPVSRIFPGPTRDSLLCAHNSSHSIRYIGDINTPDTGSVVLQLKPWEAVCEVVWCVSPLRGKRYCAIMATHSITIFDSELNLVTETHVDDRSARPSFFSCLWIGASLIYSTDTQICYMTLDGTCHVLASLPSPECYVCGVWPDRIFIARRSTVQTEFMLLPVGLLEPLVLGELGLAKVSGTPLQDETLKNDIRKLVSVFDYKRVSRYMIEKLEAQGFSDVALAIIRSSHLYPTSFKLRLAQSSMQFITAYHILEHERLNIQSIDTSELYQLYKQLGKACCAYAQFDLAKKCFERSNAGLELLQLCVFHRSSEEIEKLSDSQLAFAQMHVLANDSLIAGQEPVPIENHDFDRMFPSYRPTPITQVVEEGTYSDEEKFVPLLGLQNVLEKWFPLELDTVKSTTHLHLMGSNFAPSADFQQLLPTSPFADLNKRTNRIKKKIRETPVTTENIVLEPEPRSDVNTRKQYTIASCSSIMKELSDIHGVTEDDKTSHTEVDSVFTATNADDMSDNEEEDGMTDDLSISTPTHPPPPPLVPLPDIDATPPPPKPAHLSQIAEAAASLQQSSEGMRGFKLHFTDALGLLEEGQFAIALQSMRKASHCLLDTGDPSRKQREIKLCVAYSIALVLLLRIKISENESDCSRVARYLHVLSRLPLRPDHRVAFIEMAIERNMEEENYGVAASLLRTLLTRNEVDRPFHLARLKTCEDHGLTNASAPEENNGITNRRPRFCCQTFVVINEPPYIVCSFCDTTFMEEVQHSGEQCPFCCFGTLTRKTAHTPITRGVACTTSQ